MHSLVQESDNWPDDFNILAPAATARRRAGLPGQLPPEVAASLWRANQLGSSVTSVVSTGFADLDAALPGGGWPCQSLTEILQPQPTVAEWRGRGYPAGRRQRAGCGRHRTAEITALAWPSTHRPQRTPTGVDQD